MDRESTSSLGQDQLARLLKIGSEEGPHAAEEDGVVSDRDKLDLLQEMLGSAIQGNEIQTQSLPAIILRACQDLGPPAAGSDTCILLDPLVQVATLERIKARAKAMAKAAESCDHREVATVLYYAAIAGALIFHGKRITRNPADKLCQAFEELRTKAWLPRAIADLLDRAARICKTETQGGD